MVTGKFKNKNTANRSTADMIYNYTFFLNISLVIIPKHVTVGTTRYQ
jgi:hypothetical protein